MKVKVEYSSKKKVILTNVDNQKMHQIKRNNNIIRYEVISYNSGGLYDQEINI